MRVTWEQVVSVARALEKDATRDDVAPEDGALLVRLLLRFEEFITDGEYGPKTAAGDETW